jgi:hypothetical protein
MADTIVDDDSVERLWRKGDHIFAIWAGNGAYYGAVVDEVDNTKRTMKVVWNDQDISHQDVTFDQIKDPAAETTAWSAKKIDRHASVRDSKDKGRCLFTNDACAPGQVVFVEKPIQVVLPAMAPKIWEYLTKLHESQPLNLGTVTFYYAGLLSHLLLDKESIDIIVDKFVPDQDEEPSEDVARILKNLEVDMHENLKQRPVDPGHLQRLVSAWRYNSFGHHRGWTCPLQPHLHVCSFVRSQLLLVLWRR